MKNRSNLPESRNATNAPGASLSLHGRVIDDEVYSERKVSSFVAVASQFRRCQFANMAIEQACFGGGTADSIYSSCTFDGSNIRAIAPGCARFVRCSFRDVVLHEFYCTAVEFVDCIFSGTIRHAFFNGTVPISDQLHVGRIRNEFTGNDFSNADLIDVAFRTGIDLSNQKLPLGSDYLYLPSAADSIRSAEAVVSQWEPEARRKALVVLDVFARETVGGQSDLLLRLVNLPLSLRPEGRRIFELLRGK